MQNNDYTDTAKVEQRVRETANELHRMTGEVADARTVAEFASERRKNLLSVYTLPLLLAGKSAAAAEVEARANEKYQDEILNQERQFRTAKKVIETQAALRVKHEAARSILSKMKEALRILQG